MGADNFGCTGYGKTAREAFQNAREAAQHENGYEGYTGTIAEKDSFKMICVPQGREHMEYIDELFNNDDRRISDKWGPAGCIKIRDGEFCFFGYASC